MANKMEIEFIIGAIVAAIPWVFIYYFGFDGRNIITLFLLLGFQCTGILMEIFCR